MSKFKIEHGASKVNLVLLKTNIEESVAQDLDMLAEWSNNDRKYIVNELLRFAISQEEDFLRYKANLTTATTQASRSSKPAQNMAKPASDSSFKSDPSQSNTTAHS